jgi:hypothetical protein
VPNRHWRANATARKCDATQSKTGASTRGPQRGQPRWGTEGATRWSSRTRSSTAWIARRNSSGRRESSCFSLIRTSRTSPSDARVAKRNGPPGPRRRAFASVSRLKRHVLRAARTRRFPSVRHRDVLYSVRNVFSRESLPEREDCKSFRFGCHLRRLHAPFSSIS